MRHLWMFEVLADLRAYALANGLPKTALAAAEAEAVARAEIAGMKALPDTDDSTP